MNYTVSVNIMSCTLNISSPKKHSYYSLNNCYFIGKNHLNLKKYVNDNEVATSFGLICVVKEFTDLGVTNNNGDLVGSKPPHSAKSRY